jgi:hypothetical protein
MGGGVARWRRRSTCTGAADGIDYLEKKTYGSRLKGDYVFSGDEAIILDSSEGIDIVFENNYGDFLSNIWTTTPPSSVRCLPTTIRTTAKASAHRRSPWTAPAR